MRHTVRVLPLHHLLLYLEVLLFEGFKFLFQIEATPLRLLRKVHMIDRDGIVDLDMCVIIATSRARMGIVHIQRYLPLPLLILSIAHVGAVPIESVLGGRAGDWSIV